MKHLPKLSSLFFIVLVALTIYTTTLATKPLNVHYQGTALLTQEEATKLVNDDNKDANFILKGNGDNVAVIYDFYALEGTYELDYEKASTTTKIIVILIPVSIGLAALFIFFRVILPNFPRNRDPFNEEKRSN